MRNQFWIYFLIASLAFGCASPKVPKTQNVYGPQPEPVYPVPIGPAESLVPQVNQTPPVGNPADVKPNGEPIPENRVENRKIALVLGGAGVASFATVGLLKRFQEEGVNIEYIITTGWPTLFTLGFGLLRSVHDVEWFASRLRDRDFHNAGIFNKGSSSVNDQLSGLIESTFRQGNLSQSKVPIIISASNTELSGSEIYEQGDWKEPLLKTMSIPGIYRPFASPNGSEWIQSLRGLDVEEAEKRGSHLIVAVDMYDDYLESFKGKKDPQDKVFKKLYVGELKKHIAKELKAATLSSRIVLGKAPNDFGARRAAILAGYKEGTRLVKELQSYLRYN
jgi:hypothetical protein